MTQQWWSIAHVIFFSSSSNFFNLGQVIATSDTKCKTPAGEIEPSPDLTYQVGVHFHLLENGGEFLKYKKKHRKPPQLCAWGKEKDACPGDSGGPLAVIEDGNYVLLGLVRFFSVFFWLIFE